MYYHASPVKGLTQLRPQVSNHGIPLVYFFGEKGKCVGLFKQFN